MCDTSEIWLGFRVNGSRLLTRSHVALTLQIFLFIAIHTYLSVYIIYTLLRLYLIRRRRCREFRNARCFEILICFLRDARPSGGKVSRETNIFQMPFRSRRWETILRNRWETDKRQTYSRQCENGLYCILHKLIASLQLRLLLTYTYSM